MESSVSKGGELLLQTQIVRNKNGVNVTVRASSAIEDMMATMSGDATPQDVAMFHRYWKSERDLQVYALAADLAGLKGTSARMAYRLDRPGQPLDLPPERGLLGTSVVNLSFLRLVGVSGGITFTVNQVYSRDGVADLCKKLEEATRHFYIQYLKPVDMRIMVMTQEIS